MKRPLSVVGCDGYPSFHGSRIGRSSIFVASSSPAIFSVAGRGEMQIAILVEQMRREGHEVLVSRPEVLWKKGPDGQPLEPIEKVFVEIPNENLGAVMENQIGRAHV